MARPHCKSEMNDQLEFLTQTLKIKGSVHNSSLLEACELFVKKVNDHCAEYKAGEYGEKASNACRGGDEVHFICI